MKFLEDNETLTWDTLCNICVDYTNEDKEKERKEAAKSALDMLLTIKKAHSIRFRHKEYDSLLRKIISSNIAEKVKYNGINELNYHKIITDFIGFRILIRYKQEWEEIHNDLTRLFDIDKKRYIEKDEDYVLLYEDNDVLKYFALKPVVYYREGDDLSLYEGKIEVKKSDLNYRSIHYIVKYQNHYLEIQVRTLFEEGWSECNHDLLYKAPVEPKKIMLTKSSNILSELAHQADELCSFMYDVDNGILST